MKRPLSPPVPGGAHDREVPETLFDSVSLVSHLPSWLWVEFEIVFFPTPLGGGKEVSFQDGIIRECFHRSHHVMEAQGAWSLTMQKFEDTG